MKTKILIGTVLVSILLLTGVVYGQSVAISQLKPTEYEIDGNTVGLWHFDEGNGIVAYDETLNGNNGTLQNGARFVNKHAPIIGSTHAIRLDGDDDSIKILDSNFLDITDKITVEAWIYLNSSTNNYPARIISKWQTNNWVDGRSWLLQVVDYSGAPNHVGFWVRSSTNNQEGVVSTNAIPTDRRVHVAGVFDGNDIKIYIDGQLEGSKNFPASIFNSITNVGIGADVDDPTQYNFNGYIDEVRISDKARDPSEFNV